MKKTLFIFCIAVTTLVVFAFRPIKNELQISTPNKTVGSEAFKFENDLLSLLKDQVGPAVFYKVDSRFIATITLEKLYSATTILDILPEHARFGIESVQAVNFSVLKEDHELREVSFGAALTPAQLLLLKSTDYADNIRIEANYTSKNIQGDAGNNMQLVYYISVTPEQPAKYTDGYAALIHTLKKGSEDQILRLDQDQLKPGKVNFTVTKNGTVAHVRIAESSGFADLDQAMLELIKSLPKNWNPAKNALGEPVEQDLVFFFGREGC